MDEFMDVVSGFREIEGRLIGRAWTEEENNILREWYPIEGTKVKDRLSGRSEVAIKVQAKKLRLSILLQWTEEENEILRKYYLVEGYKIKDRLVGRTKKAVQVQAGRLGLKCKNNSKYKYITKIKNKYVVRLDIDGKKRQFGTYDSEEEAAKVAKEKAKEYGKVI